MADGTVCPDCKGDRISNCKRVGFYHCNACNFDFTIRTGTIFERSKVPLHKWVYSMYLLVTARKGISSCNWRRRSALHKRPLGSSWDGSGKRESPDSIDKLKGIMEIDEAFFGGLEGNKHESKKLHAGRGASARPLSLGCGNVAGGPAKVTPIRTLESIHGEILGDVETGRQIYTDEHMVFRGLTACSTRTKRSISAGEYARGAHHEQIESVWAVLKRGLHGVYHHATPKHLFRYVDEFTWRLNEGDVKRHTLQRLDSFIGAIVGKRLTYARLIAKVSV